MYSEIQALSHMMLQKPEDWRSGLEMYNSDMRSFFSTGMTEIDQIMHRTEYGPEIYVALIGLIVMILATSYDPTPDIPLEMIERVYSCHQSYPLGSHICTSPDALYEQLTR